MFISTAYAQGGPFGGGGDLMGTLLFLLPMLAIFYFLLVRPQQQRVKKHQEMVAGIKRGDTVITNGGIVGKVIKVNEGELEVEIAENTRVRVIKGMVAEVRAKGEPVKEAA
jgi:preprotein translocase subunit YajC